MSGGSAILVTGGAGYIGSHCCRALAAAGYVPVVYDNLSTGHRHFVTGALVVGDVADGAMLKQTLRDYDIKAVMHFAASSLVEESTIDPRKYYDNNLAGGLSLLNAMLECDCKLLVFSSTGAVYGAANSEALREDTSCAPISPYGASKWMFERVLADYGKAYDVRSFSLRYFNASGASIAGDIGEDRKIETHLIPRAMMALTRSTNFAVFGDDYDTPDGTAVRDYIHVSDLADAHVLALKLLIDGHRGDVLNLGTGTGFSVKDILSAISAEAGREVPHAIKSRRAGDPTYLVADVSAARRTLGFRPIHSDLKTIVRTAWAWQSKLDAQRNEN